MTGAEQGFLLLTSHLGDPHRKCLTTAQFRQLAIRVRGAEKNLSSRDLEAKDLNRLGYGADAARQILSLLDQQFLLDHYLERCQKAGCGVLTRISEHYPQLLRTRLGLDAPGTLWYRGNLSLLNTPMISLVGSRDIFPDNARFAKEAGHQAALQGYTLISGNARGADRIGQESCLAAGGNVIRVLADRLCDHSPSQRELYLSEDGFDCSFSAPRALSRNRIIHALPKMTFVAQCTFESGGTWQGTFLNLRNHWSPVFMFDDGSKSAAHFDAHGAELIDIADLANLNRQSGALPNLFDL